MQVKTTVEGDWRDRIGVLAARWPKEQAGSRESQGCLMG